MSFLDDIAAKLRSSNNTPPKKDAAAAPPPVAAPPEKKIATPAKAPSEAPKNSAAPAVMSPKMKVGPDGRVVFQGKLLTAPGGPLNVPEESRAICALFDSGLWLVSESHKLSPLVTSVAALARRLKYQIDEPVYVQPDIVQQAYISSDRRAMAMRLDDNAMRRKIAEVLKQACELGANDIHIESSKGRTTVQFRVDGLLRLWETWTQREGEQFLASVWSHCDVQSGVTANWLEPQAAMMKPSMSNDAVAFPEEVGGVRCQWMPLVSGGRYLDMRLHFEGARILGGNINEAEVDVLGFNAEQIEVIKRLRRIPGGMRVISGPTNQGKTTTLRVMLSRRMAETHYKLNCLLIEDPPEGPVTGARQIGVSAAQGDEARERIFSEIMRASLRLDPDIVMLGEIRDFQSATMAFRLALTGRQIYTTIHVYSALAIPKRIRDLGIEPYLIFDPYLLRGLMAQRLVKMICKHCRIPLREAIKDNLDRQKMALRLRAGLAEMESRRHKRGEARYPLQEPDLSNVFLLNPDGCPHCYEGRSGRTVLGEVVETDEHLMGLLQENKMEDAIAYWLSPDGLNGISMLWHGLMQVKEGRISPEDLEFEIGLMASDRYAEDVCRELGQPPW